MSESQDAMLARHRKEERDLINRIASMKKQATKSRRKQVNSKCEELMNDLKNRHIKETQKFNGIEEEEEEEEEEVTPETLLAQLSLQQEKTEPATTTEPPQQKSKKRNRQKEKLAKREAEIAKIKQEALQEGSGQQPNLQQLEQEALDQLCHMKRLKQYDISPDGHCMFASVLDQVNQRHTRLQHKPDLDVYELRRLACNYIRENKDDFIPYLFDETTMQLRDIDEYTQEMESTAKWGGEIELLALSKVFDCPISVMMSGSATHMVNPGAPNPELKLVYYKHSYALGEHYNSLRDDTETSISSRPNLTL